MAQFTVYRNKNPRTRSAVPLLLDVQNDLLDNLDTRVLVPLRPTVTAGIKRLQTLTPVLEIEGKSYLMLTPLLAGVPKSEIGTPIARVEQYRFDIIAAIDFLVTGV